MERLDPDGGDDRVARVKAYAARTGCVTLLKGPETIVAAPDGRLRVVISGTPALATAGTGDVLAGLIGAGIAGGLDPFTAAWLGAHVHGLAGQRLPHRGGASLLAACVREVLSR
jgi:NAD(P)H-hydrate repair Nnr-like enzyme with NAD(P)H-hydrate dehydratase domain